MAYCSDEIYQVILSVSPFNYKGKLAVLFYCEKTVYWNWNQICLSFKKYLFQMTNIFTGHAKIVKTYLMKFDEIILNQPQIMRL